MTDSIDFASKNTFYKKVLSKTFNKKPITERIKFYEIHGLSKKHLYIIISKEISNFIFININLNNYIKWKFLSK
jgi:hypothetical protein